MPPPELSQNELRDETSAELLKLLREKQEKKQDVVLTGEEKAGGSEGVPDLVAILKQSLAGRTGQRPKHSRAGTSLAASRPHRLRSHFAKRAHR